MEYILFQILNLLDFMKESFINEHRKFAPEIINQLTSANIKVGYPQRLYNDDLVLQIYNNVSCFTIYCYKYHKLVYLSCYIISVMRVSDAGRIAF